MVIDKQSGIHLSSLSGSADVRKVGAQEAAWTP